LIKYFFHTFGCRVNQYETQSLRERLLSRPDSSEVGSFKEADLCLVNTCSVTREADKDALRLVRRISRRNPSARLVVTGCLASRDPEAILKEAPAALVVGNEGKEALAAMLGCQSAPPWAGLAGFKDKTRAFVKIQDGCNMSCSFCIIPAVRPKLLAKPYEELEAECCRLLAGGRQELVLCGIRLGRYLVEDANGRRVDFTAMLERLLALPGDFRIRLSSLEITDLTERLILLMLSSRGRLCPSLHLPLQSGSESVLRRMRRWYSAAFYERRVCALRSHLPEAGIFADVMAGFPGENAEEFEESLGFIERLGFSGLHVFRYSNRPGTPASRRKDSLPEKLIVDRAERLKGLDFRLRSAFAAQAVGGLRRVLVQRRAQWSEGLSEDFLSLRLEGSLGPGLHLVRVTRAEGPVAWAQSILVPARLKA
jgi:threonylcarbamoyladenosine tRNA methylthiotransferase MtaB